MTEAKKVKAAIINEIEKLKKQEDESEDSKVNTEDVEKRNRKRKKERKKVRSPSPAKQRYPANWSELLEMRLELSDLKLIKGGRKSVRNSCVE